MKIKSLLLTALMVSAITQITVPYTINFKNSVPEVQAVNTYVYRDVRGFNDYLKRKGLDTKLIDAADQITGVTKDGAAVLKDYQALKGAVKQAESKQAAAKKTPAPDSSDMELELAYEDTKKAPRTAGENAATFAAALELGVKVAKILKDAVKDTGWYDDLLRWKVIDATHKNLTPGNSVGWGWQDIKKDLGVGPDDRLYIVITDLEGHLLHQGAMLASDAFNFSVTKDAEGTIKAVKQ
jgi:hypothetical protein